MTSNTSLQLLGGLLCELIDHRGRTPKKLGGDFSESGVVVLSAKNVKSGEIILNSDVRYVSREMWDRWMPVKLKVGDILLTSEAPLGEAVYLSEKAEYCLGQRLFALRGDPRKINARYLYYALISPSVQARLLARSTGTTAQGIRQSELVKVLVEVLPKKDQDQIARILGTLDDKIELNQKMNATLEAMARVTFKSWFVDFDPVRAKAEGEEPVGMDAETAALFPDDFEEVGGQEVPEGWNVSTIGSVLELAYGKALKESDRHPGQIPVYGSNGQVGWHDEPLVKGPGIIIGRKGNPGTVAWSQTDFFPIDTTFYVVPKVRSMSLLYLYYELMFQNLPSQGSDSAVPGLNRNIAYMNSITIPSNEIIKRFDATIIPLFKLVHLNTMQSRTLAALRDTLLPKLISGEIRVPDAMLEVAEA